MILGWHREFLLHLVKPVYYPIVRVRAYSVDKGFCDFKTFCHVLSFSVVSKPFSLFTGKDLISNYIHHIFVIPVYIAFLAGRSLGFDPRQSNNFELLLGLIVD